MDKSVGPVASCIVQAGTLRVGDMVTAGTGYGRVKSMVDASGDQKDQVTPSFAVQVRKESRLATNAEREEERGRERERATHTHTRTQRRCGD